MPFLPGLALLLAQALPLSAADAAPLRFDQHHTLITGHSDGIWESRSELVVTLRNSAGVAALGQLALPFVEGLSTVSIEDVHVRKIHAPVILPSAADCLRFEQESFGALHQMLGKLDEAAKARAWAEVGEKLSAFENNGRFEGPCVMIAAVGRRA